MLESMCINSAVVTHIGRKMSHQLLGSYLTNIARSQCLFPVVSFTPSGQQPFLLLFRFAPTRSITCRLNEHSPDAIILLMSD